MITFAKETVYITTAIDYPNASPHIGHAYEKIAADVQARWKKSRGFDVFFLTGTDEHGLKLFREAESRGIKPKKFLDVMVKEFKETYEQLGIKPNRFIRTTDKDHEEQVQQLIKKVQKSGDIYKGSYEGLYCVGCERYLTERELENDVCPFHQKKPELLKEETYFFKLSKYQDKLLDFYKKNPKFIQPKSVRNEIINRVKEGLNDLSITRTSFTWGVPFPGDPKHVLYVWFDALPNYITGIKWGKDKKFFNKYWPAKTHHIGRAIAWFHTVIWPAQLMSAGLKIPKQVFGHGYLTANGQKMSKSLGNVLHPKDLIDKYGADSVRYTILKEIPYSEDGDFSEKSLATRHNNELANDLGNLVSRGLTLIEKFAKGKVPKPDKLGPDEIDMMRICNRAIENSDEKMELLEYHHALDEIWKVVSAANKYVDLKKPWTLKGKALDTVIYQLADTLRVICSLIEPFLPFTADKMAKQLGISIPAQKGLKPHKIKVGTKVKKGKQLFPKIEFKEDEKIIYKGDFSILDLRVAKILEIENVKEAKKLLKLKVDLGELGKRQLIAGLKEYYSHESLKGKSIAVVANLKPAKIKGHNSEGMLLAAEDNRGKVELLDLKKSKPGERITVDGLELPPKAEVEYNDFSVIRMVVKNGHPTWNDKPLKTKHEKIKLTKVKDGAKVL